MIFPQKKWYKNWFNDFKRIPKNDLYHEDYTCVSRNELYDIYAIHEADEYHWFGGQWHLLFSLRDINSDLPLGPIKHLYCIIDDHGAGWAKCACQVKLLFDKECI